MIQIENNELVQIMGGNSILIGVAVAAIVVFISGVIEGITNPGRCGE